MSFVFKSKNVENCSSSTVKFWIFTCDLIAGACIYLNNESSIHHTDANVALAERHWESGVHDIDWLKNELACFKVVLPQSDFEYISNWVSLRLFCLITTELNLPNQQIEIHITEWTNEKVSYIFQIKCLTIKFGYKIRN